MSGNSVMRISDLPDEILCRIISLFPIKQAVLSRRWKNVFTLISDLDITMDINEVEELERFMNLVDRLVFFRDVPSLLSFSLVCYGYVDPHRLEKWICALVQHKLQKLELWMNTKFEDLLLPSGLFSCKSLVELRLATDSYYDLKIPSRIYPPCLKSLCLEGIGFPDDGSDLFKLPGS